MGSEKLEFLHDIFFNSKTVKVKQEMAYPGEIHDKCKTNEISSDLQCDMIDGFLTCRPEKCGIGDRFRCDCSVYELVQPDFFTYQMYISEHFLQFLMKPNVAGLLKRIHAMIMT